MQTSKAPVWNARTIIEALALRAEHPEATVLAGGTDIMVFIEGGGLELKEVLNIWPCDELRTIEVTDEGAKIGALATWADVRNHTQLPHALRECAQTVGADQIQNRGTVGGNIVNASPAGDSLPLWLALDASFELGSVRGRRMVRADDFWTGYRRTALEKDELLLAVHIGTNPDIHTVYRKVGTRMAQAISKVVFGGAIKIENGVVTQARLALGSVAPTPVRLTQVEDALLGNPIDPAVADKVNDAIAPIDDIRSTEQYRRSVARRIVRSWLERKARES